LNVTRVQLLQPFLPLLAVLLLFAALALLLSMLLPSARLAGMVTGALLVANFLLDALAQLNEELESVVRLTPLYYYQGGSAIHGIEWEWLAGLLLVAALLAVAAWALFQRRDIRVGGEHSWRLADLWPNPF
jgi:putative exporter of polyketide antibiotics